MQPKIRSLVLLALAVFAIHGAQAQQPAVPMLTGYRIILRSSSAPYQISTPDEPKRKNWFVDPDSDDKALHTFGDAQRFEAKKFEKKKVPDPRVGELDVSELIVVDHKTKRVFTLVMKKEYVFTE